jgi:UDP-glucose 4-epimerase
MLQVAAGLRDHLSVFGDDWPTVDGSGVRDYLHVVDLALGQVRALQYCAEQPGFTAVNLGTGHGISLLELVRVRAGHRPPVAIKPRRRRPPPSIGRRLT